MISLDGADETFKHIGMLTVTRLQLEIMGTPSGSSRNASVAIFIPPFRKTRRPSAQRGGRTANY